MLSVNVLKGSQFLNLCVYQQIEAGGLKDCQGGKVTVFVWESAVSV
jgi:hypothetical protein